MNEYTKNGISPETLQAWGAKEVQIPKEPPLKPISIAEAAKMLKVALAAPEQNAQNPQATFLVLGASLEIALLDESQAKTEPHLSCPSCAALLSAQITLLSQTDGLQALAH